MISMLHYSPSKGYFGDPIPFYAMGRYHVFYDMIKPDGKICWGHISSLDLLNWEEHSIAIDNGAFGSWDEQQCIKQNQAVYQKAVCLVEIQYFSTQSAQE